MSNAFMSSEKALAIIDRHLLRPKGSDGRESSGHYYASRRNSTERARKLPKQPAFLPAFWVSARDGPSPFDSHKGQATCPLDDIWTSRQPYLVREELAACGTLPGVAAERPIASPSVVDNLRCAVSSGAAECTLEPDYFNGVAHHAVLAVRDGDASLSDKTPPIRNPARDRVELTHQVAVKAGDETLRRAKNDREGLYRACVRNYPHGALGVRESPSGDNPGAVYRRHGEAIRRKGLHDNRKLLGFTSMEPEDHLRGSIVMRDCGARDGLILNIAPRDNLFGGVNVE